MLTLLSSLSGRVVVEAVVIAMIDSPSSSSSFSSFSSFGIRIESVMREARGKAKKYPRALARVGVPACVAARVDAVS